MALLHSQMKEGLRLLVRGQVQGVGFRPFVYRLGLECGLVGRVFNDAAGVCIEVEGMPESLADFQSRLRPEAPAVAQIDEVIVERCPLTGFASFAIVASSPTAPPLVRVPRDLAVCADCVAEIDSPANRRRDHAFASCTACGPRYSIVTALPYDRRSTAMQWFPMCRACHHEYHTCADRRFHAQPIACADCGPQLALWDRSGRTVADQSTALESAAEALRRGDIVALKGLGGYQLLARADQAETLRRLRSDKRRPTKPLAVMVPHVAAAERIAQMGELERRELVSAANPIVVCTANPRNTELVEEVAPHTATVGLMLPTTPLHHLLLARLGMPIIATSGNLSEEPMVVDERAALARLGSIADVFLVHDRPIVRALDDSVVRVVDGRTMTIRLGRGLAPLPLPTLERLANRLGRPPLLALGGHQKVAPALWTGTQSVLAQHIGDLDHPESRTAFEETVRDMRQLYLTQPTTMVCDLHPEYFTTHWASRQETLRRIQHHHAHAAACMVEHDLLDREVLALTWDGTGYGPDGQIWGGEILRATLSRFERVASLLPFPLPGGESAIRQPARIALGLLSVLLGAEELSRRADLLHRLGISHSEAHLLTVMIRRGVNCPWTTSMGRLFDGIASLLPGVAAVTYEGEAAVWLEAIADVNEAGPYAMPIDRTRQAGDWRPMLSEILNDLKRDVAPSRIAARFHNTLAQWAGAVAGEIDLPDVVLGGGCFQNRLLTERVADTLRTIGRRVHVPGAIPANDGGLSVGQLAIALQE